MNALFVHLGLEWLKPFLTALLLPPFPFLVLALVGLVAFRRRQRRGSALVGASLLLVWLSGCIGVGDALESLLLDVPPPLDAARMAELQRLADAPVAIIVLGAGLEEWAPEYGASSLHFRSLERLRYGIWLSRKTDWPIGFSGGLGWAQPSGSAREAEVAQRIATDEFKRPLSWVEARSRDTRENARFTLAMLRPVGIKHIMLVTHGMHMPRALRNFRSAGGPDVTIEAAPLGLAKSTEWPLLGLVPTGEGVVEVRSVLREWIGSLSGA